MEPSAEDLELEKELVKFGGELETSPSDAKELLQLLDEVEASLSKVEQSPSKSMLAALGSIKKALVARSLLEHPDIDVKVSVASCASEITRITAPEAPYDDDVMKVIFRLTVEAFRNLDDMSSRSFSKRVSILETVGRVRSCVMMLDLECDALILEMFQDFLRTIRSNHPETVFSSMVLIMTLMLDESEDNIPSELLSCLIDSVNDKEVLPVARRLGVKVITLCAEKLKRCLLSYGLSDYSNIVTSILEDKSDAMELTETNASGEALGSAKLDQEVGSPAKVGTCEKSPISVTGNGTVLRGDDDSVEQPGSPKQKPEQSDCSGQVKGIVSIDKTDSDNINIADVKSDNTEDQKSEQQMEENATDLLQNDSDLQPTSLPCTSELSNKEATLEVDIPADKAAEPTMSIEPVEEKNLQSDKDTTCVTSPTTNRNAVDATRRKKARPFGSKASTKKSSQAVPNPPSSASVEKEDTRNSKLPDEAVPSEDNDPKKDVAGSSLEGSADRHTGEKVPSDNTDDGKIPASVTSDSEAKPLESTRRRVYKKKDTGEKVPLEKTAHGKKPASVTSDSEAKPLESTGKRVYKKKDTGEKVPLENSDDGKKPASVTSDSEAKPLESTGKKVYKKKDTSEKVPLENSDDGKKPASVTRDSQAKPVGSTGKRGYKKKDAEGGSSGKQPKSIIKHAKKKGTDKVEAAGNMSVEDVPTSPKSGTSAKSNDQNQTEDAFKAQSKRKRARGTEEIPGKAQHKVKLDKSLVGSKIQIWWPDDESFYTGIVDSFDPSTKKHKILYDDGDIETLILKDERYILGEGGREADGGEEVVRSPNATPEVTLNKKTKTEKDSKSKQVKAEVPSKSGPDSSQKPRGRPKSGASAKLDSLSSDSIKTLTKSKEKPVSISKEDIPKSSSKQKGSMKKSKEDSGEFEAKSSETGINDDSPKGSGKLKDMFSKSGKKSRDNIPKAISKLKGDTPTGSSKLADRSLEDNPKKRSKSKDNLTSKGKSEVRDTKSKDNTPRSGKKQKTINTVDEASADGTSDRGKAKVSDTETPTGAEKAQTGTGKKRKRKDQK